jgi:hypothetical protein
MSPLREKAPRPQSAEEILPSLTRTSSKAELHLLRGEIEAYGESCAEAGGAQPGNANYRKLPAEGQERGLELRRRWSRDRDERDLYVHRAPQIAAELFRRYTHDLWAQYQGLAESYNVLVEGDPDRDLQA